MLLRQLLALALAMVLVGCAKTFLIVDVEKHGTAKLTLLGGSLDLAGPARVTFVCRTWGDSYFEVWQGTNAWTCSGGQLSDNGVKFGGVVVDAAVKAAAAAMGAGALQGGGDLLGELLRRGATVAPAPDAADRGVVLDPDQPIAPEAAP